MRLKVVLAVAALALAAGSYFAGLLPERQERRRAEARAEQLRVELDAAQGRLRVAALLGTALTLEDVTLNLDYGQARDLSTAFFDEVRAESVATTDEGLRSGLSQALVRRDAVTTALATGDAAVVQALQEIELDLRRALGYAVPPPPASSTP